MVEVKYVILDTYHKMYFVDSEYNGNVYTEAPEESKLFDSREDAVNCAVKNITYPYHIQTIYVKKLVCRHLNISIQRKYGKWGGFCKDCGLKMQAESGDGYCDQVVR